MQAAFIVMIAIAGMGCLAIVWGMVRCASQPHRITIVGGIFLLCFIVVRAASFHHFDQVLGWQVGQVRMNHVFELGGIACIAWGAFQAARARRKLLGPAGPQQFQWRHCESP